NRATTDTSSAPLEGMSTVRHPLLADACLLFNANARGELLPAAGPVKIRDDRAPSPGQGGAPGLPAPPPVAPPPMAGGAMGQQGPPPMGPASGFPGAPMPLPQSG